MGLKETHHLLQKHVAYIMSVDRIFFNEKYRNLTELQISE